MANRTMNGSLTERTMPFHSLGDDAKSIVERATRDGRITPDDGALLREYVTERRAEKHLSPGRVNKILYNLLLWRKFIQKPFRDHSITDIHEGISEMLTKKTPDGKTISQNTLYDTVAIFKPFYFWMIDAGYSTIPEKKLRAIKRPPIDKMTKTADDLLSPEEIEAILSACSSARDRALIHLLYEGGFRIGEIGNLRWGDIKFDDNGAVVNVNFKTGKPRYIRLVMAKQVLATWKKDHPDARQDAYVFLDRSGSPIQYYAVLKQVQRLVKRAGITKHVTPHTFRHSRITHLIREGRMNESVIKLIMWGSTDTDMFSTYLHLTGGDIDQQVNEAYGLVDKKASREKRIEPRQCSRCGEINSPVAKFCAECGMSLTAEAAAEVDYLEAETDRFYTTINPQMWMAIKDRIDKEIAAKLATRKKRSS